MTTTGTDARGTAAGVVDEHASRAAAGAGYAHEWGLFCDYTTAVGAPTLPTTVATLTGFLAHVPARPATQARHRRGPPQHRPPPGPARGR
jgi:hypothetical protein